VSVRVEQADFDELLGLLMAEYSLVDSVLSRIVELRAANKLFDALLEELQGNGNRKRIELHRIVRKLQALLAKDPEHTPLPTRASRPPGDLTRSKNSRPPPPRNVPPPRRTHPPPLPRKKT
jgi:hypothetical protein